MKSNPIEHSAKNKNKFGNEVKIIRKVTLVGFWINFGLVIIKLLFGYLGHSDALVADGYHSVSDFVTDFIVLIFVGIAYKKADVEHPYGHGKYETIATVLIGIILFFIGIFIAYEGVNTIIGSFNGIPIPIPSWYTVIVAIISILAKEFCFKYTIKAGNRINSNALKANAWHHRSDAFSSVATLIGVSASLLLGAKWTIMDPICAILISILIMVSAYKISKPSINELLEVGIPDSQREEILKLIKDEPGVKKVHNLRSRRNGHSLIIDVNIHVDPDITVRASHQIATNIENSIRNKFGSDCIMYVHIEPEI